MFKIKINIISKTFSSYVEIFNELEEKLYISKEFNSNYYSPVDNKSNFKEFKVYNLMNNYSGKIRKLSDYWKFITNFSFGKKMVKEQVFMVIKFIKFYVI
jgi:hypothetical protein